MAGFDGLLDAIPVGDIAKQFGIPESVAKDAIEQIIPAVVGGMAENSKTETGAASLEKALGKHQGATVKDVASIDTADGGKIVRNVFGDNTSKVEAAVADSSGGDVTKDLIAKLLPVVAPIILAFIANQFLGQKSSTPEPAAAPASSGGGIGDLLGGLLGSQGGQDALGGILGSLLGGGRR